MHSAFVLLLGSLAVLAAVPRPAAAAEEILLPTVEAGPGTAAGVPGVLGASDDVRVTGTEADVTANLNALRWLKPNGDLGTAWTEVGASGCVPTTLEYCYIDEDPIQDGDTTSLTSNPGLGATQTSNYAVEDWPGPTDVTIDGFSVFAWSKFVTLNNLEYRIQHTEGAGGCGTVLVVLSSGYANASSPLDPDCDGNGLSFAEIDGHSITQSCTDLNGDASTCQNTAMGTLIQYDDRDQQLALYLNFTNLPSPGGYDYRLEWEASESLAAETASLQVLRDGVWTLLAAVPTSESLATYEVQPSEYAGGTARFRIVDDIATEEVAESVAVDVFRIVATPRSISDPGAGAIRVDCVVASALFRNELRCTATEGFNASIVRARTWYVDGRIVETPDELGTRLVHDVGPGFVPTAHTWNVTYQVLLLDGTVLEKAASAILDTSWLWAAYVLVLLLAGVAGALEVRPRRPRQEPPRRSE